MRYVFAFVFIILICSCTITSNVVKEPSYSIEAYFCPEDMCKEKIMSLIENASDIRCAFYDLDLPDMIALLKEKNAEVVIEDSNKLDDFYTGYSFALMHNKFCIFDNSIILTGSMNPTERGNFYNNNNIIIVNSKALAENYLDEFYELKNNQYGKGEKVKHPIVYLGHTMVENYFCPEDNCKLHVINALQEANSSIYFMTYSFTDEDIGNLLWNKNYLGLDVKGVFETSQISDYSRYEDLKKFSVLDNNKYNMHHKVFIIDNKTVITGSFNPSQNANERNDENIIIIHDKEIAEKYVEEFKKIFEKNDLLPVSSSELILYRIIYDAPGSDTGNERVLLKNIGEKELVLDYYGISDNKSSMRLSGMLSSNRTISIIPSFSLKNKNGTLLLRHNSEIIDYAYWEGAWEIDAGENAMQRKDISKISESSWIID